jgi:hypothetical protein
MQMPPAGHHPLTGDFPSAMMIGNIKWTTANEIDLHITFCHILYSIITALVDVVSPQVRQTNHLN